MSHGDYLRLIYNFLQGSAGRRHVGQPSSSDGQVLIRMRGTCTIRDHAPSQIYYSISLFLWNVLFIRVITDLYVCF
jgi:hypothetical protein